MMYFYSYFPNTPRSFEFKVVMKDEMEVITETIVIYLEVTSRN